MKKLSCLVVFLMASGVFCEKAFSVMPQRLPATRERAPAVNSVTRARLLTVTDVNMNDAAAGAPGGQNARFRIRVTVQETGRCSVRSVVPAIKVKTAEGRTETARVITAREVSCNTGYLMENEFVTTEHCSMICDELRGGQATMEFWADTDNAVPALTQVGICFDPDGDQSRQECAWYPLETVLYYRMKK